MTDDGSAKKAWDDLGEQLNGLGLKLKLHFEQAKDTDEEAKMSDALSRLRVALDDAFHAVGAAAKDAAVKDDVVNVGSALGDALSKTFSQVSDEVRKAFAKAKEAAADRREDGTPES